VSLATALQALSEYIQQHPGQDWIFGWSNFFFFFFSHQLEEQALGGTRRGLVKKDQLLKFWTNSFQTVLVH
jgi:hypothetical protein